MSENIVTGSSAGVMAWNSSVQIEKSTFKNQKAYTGAFVSSNFQSQIQIVKSSFSNAWSNWGGALYLQNSSLDLVTATFDNMGSDQGGVIYASQSNLTISNSTFLNSTSEYEGSVIYMENSQLLLQKSNLSNYINTALVVVEESTLKLNQTNFSFGFSNSELGSGIYSKNSQIDMYNCNCSQQFAKMGSCFVIINDESKKNVYQFVNNSFSNCTATKHGGVGFCQNANITFIKNSFLNNRVDNKNDEQVSQGGALRLICDKHYACIYKILNSSFVNNQILNKFGEGGAISFYGTIPYLVPNEKNKEICQLFKENKAFYGNNLAAFPYQLQYSYITDVLENCTKKTPQRQLQLTLLPGQQVPERQIYITDVYGQIIKTDNSSIAQIFTKDKAELAGKTRINALQGIFDNKEVVVKGAPGENITLNLETNAIDQSFFNLMNISNKIQISISIQNCLRGQILFNGIECVNCRWGSFALEKNSSTCKDCMEGATCYGADLIMPNKGY